MDIKDKFIEYFDYLDDLRDSGRTNMWGASKYLIEELGIESTEAKSVLLRWIDTYDGISSSEERVEKAYRL